MSRSSRVTIPLLALSSVLIATASYAACDDLKPLASFNKRPISVRNDTLLFTVDRLAIDIDGAPSAYGVRDQGVENVCNGLSALSPEKCKGKAAAKACYQPCRTAFKSWYDDGHELVKMKNYMASTGLGGAGGAPPALSLQDGDRSDWFVSETSTKLRIGDRPLKWDDITKQAAQVDPLVVPYFVIPGKFRNVSWDATPGDFGVIVAPQTKRSVRFIVGDTGGNLDEASALLVAKLAGLDNPPTVTEKSALGDAVERLASPRLGTSDLRVAIFRHSGKYKGSLGAFKVLDQPSSGDFADWIDAEAGALLDKFGGVDKVVECTTAM